MTEVLRRGAPFRLIQPPSRSTRTGSGVIFLCVLLLSFVSLADRVSAWAVLLSLLLVVSFTLTREIQAFHLSCFTALLVVVPFLLPSLRTWPFQLLVPLFGYTAVVLAVPKLRATVLWLHAGRISKNIVLSMLTIAVVSGAALYVWHRALNLT